MKSEIINIHQIPGINEIAKTLAMHGLGIFLPHKHGEDGKIEELDYSEVSIENDLVVSFVKNGDQPPNSIAVGWRWNGNKIEACSECCVQSGPPKVV